MSQMDNKPSQPGSGMNININSIGMAGGVPGGMDGGAQQRGGVAGINERQTLNTYIYDYFIKNDMLECAKALLKNPNAEVQHDGNFRNSPSSRPKHEGEMNGVDDGAMDSGDRQGDDGDEPKSVQDLPKPKVPSLHGSSFLLEWWCCFTDIYWARNKIVGASNAANAYVNNTQQQQRLRNESLMRLNPQQTMMGNMQYQNRIGMVPNGVIHGGQESANGPGDLAHKQGQPLQRSAAFQRLAHQRGPQQMVNRPPMMPQGQRGEGEVNEMNGQQARPPSTAPAAASPGNKRVRLENGQYEQLGNGRGGAPQGGPPGNATNNAATAHQLLIANGINPDQMTPAQFATFQGQTPLTQQRSIQMYAQNMAAATGKNISALQGPKMPQNPGQAGSPMMPQTSEGALGNGMAEFYAAGPGGMRTGGGMGAGTGNHALQDYQMQLMLLEQQNKKRLMMARAEQDSLTSENNRPGGYPQGMSPGSRAAPSPGPGGKPNMVGTPKMNQVGPGSPLPEGQMAGHVQQRSSPAAGPQFNGQMPEGGQHPMIYQKQMESMGMMANPGAVPNGAGGMMRPPNFNGQMGQPEGMPGQMNPQMRTQQAGRGQPGMWQHPQQMQQPGQQPGQQPTPQPQQQPGGPQQGQPQQSSTPQQRPQTLNHMPPPQAPPNTANPRQPAPASPQVPNQQPPTPTQSNKPAPKAKAPRDNQKKARQTKKGAVPQTQAPNAVTPTATSEPPTPTTPQHTSFPSRQSNFAGTNPSGNASLGQPVQPPNSGPAAPSVVDSTTNDFDFNVDGSSLGFSAPDGDLGLDHFDFDSFLNTGEDNSIAFGGETLQWTDTLDSGPTDA